MRKQRLLLKAQKEERKKKAEENHAEELEINQMKIEMEREQHKATLDAQMAQITASTEANMKMIEFLTGMTGKLHKEDLNIFISCPSMLSYFTTLVLVRCTARLTSAVHRSSS